MIRMEIGFWLQMLAGLQVMMGMLVGRRGKKIKGVSLMAVNWAWHKLSGLEGGLAVVEIPESLKRGLTLLDLAGT